VLRLYRAAEHGRAARHGTVVVCLDECGPLSLRPWPGSAWAPRRRPVRTRATYHRPHGVRYLLGSYDVGTDQLSGTLVAHKDGATVLSVLKGIRARYPEAIGVFVVMDNLSAHWTPAIRGWASATASSWSRCRPTPAISTESSATSGRTWNSSFAGRTMPATTNWPRPPAPTCAIATPPITIHQSESRKAGARLPDTPPVRLRLGPPRTRRDPVS
jgi:DDE superfamily endonuclease